MITITRFALSTSLAVCGCLFARAAFGQETEAPAATAPATPAEKPATQATPEKPAPKPERPAKQETPVAAARRAVAEAQAELNKATAAYKAAKSTAAEGIKQSPQWQQLSEAQTQAQTAYAAATQPVLERVHADKQYQAAAANKQKADARLVELRASATPTADALTAAGREQYTSVALMKKLEDDALAADATAQQAKANVDAATQALADLKKQAEETATNDPAVQTAKQAVDEAEKKVEEARKALTEAIKANQPQRNTRPPPPPRQPPPPPRQKKY